jgi:hypothetical protein
MPAMSEALTLVGFGFDATGLALAAIGLWRTWHEFGPPGEGVFGYIPRALGAARARMSEKAQAVWRRVRGRKTVGASVILGGTIKGSGSVTVRARIGYPPLDPDFEVRSTIVTMDRRLRQLIDTVANAEERLGDDLERARRDLAALRLQLDAEVQRLDEQGRHVATEGVRMEATGLLLVAVGILFQAAGSLLAPR